MAKKKVVIDKSLDMGRVDFDGTTVRQDGSHWKVTWHLSKHVISAEDAASFIGQLIGIEAAAHGQWHVNVTLTKEEKPPLV